MKQKHIIEVIEDDTNEVVKTLLATSEREAMKIADGIEINLDHTRFTVNVRPAE